MMITNSLIEGTKLFSTSNTSVPLQSYHLTYSLILQQVFKAKLNSKYYLQNGISLRCQ